MNLKPLRTLLDCSVPLVAVKLNLGLGRATDVEKVDTDFPSCSIGEVSVECLFLSGDVSVASLTDSFCCCFNSTVFSLGTMTVACVFERGACVGVTSGSTGGGERMLEEGLLRLAGCVCVCV